MLPSSLTRRTAIRNTKRRGYIPNTKSNSKKKPKSQRVPWGPSGQGPGLSLPCCCSGAQSCPTFRDPTDHSTPGLPVLHRLQEFAQTHVHWVSDAIQPSSCLLPLSLPALNLSQHQGLPVSQFFTSGGQRIGASASASVLPMNIQGWFPLEWTGLICLHPKGLSRVFLNITVQRHQFFGAQPFLLSNSHIHT